MDKQLNQQYIDKMRMVEISTYFSEKYAAYNDLIKLIIMWAIPVAIIVFIGMRNPVPEHLVSKENSNTVFLVILLVVGLIGLFQILVKIYDLSRRNNMNFNEYDFDDDFEIDKIVERTGPFGQRGVDDGEGVIQHDTKAFQKMAESLNLGCVDSKCCSDGTMFDTLKKRCIPAIKAHEENNKKAALTKGSLSKDAEGIEHKASSAFHGAEDKASSAFQGAEDKASSAFHGAEDKASSAFHGAEDKASSAFHSALSMVEPMSNDNVPFSSV
jgi:predicted membrane protein